jgi:Diol dehydratase reactivase ATPase-like domain/DD-reactivating factor swiveling domain
MLIAGVDVGNATTEVVLVGGGKVRACGRIPTRGRKGSPDSLRAAAALIRRLERECGEQVAEARIAPLSAVDTALVTVPQIAAEPGRLRVLAAGAATPGGTGACSGAPLTLPADACAAASASVPGRTPSGLAGLAGAIVALVPRDLGYEVAARHLRGLLETGTAVGAVLVAADEGVLIANRLPVTIPVIDQVDVAAAAACDLLAVEVRPPGQPLTLLTDPLALSAALGAEASEATAVARTLAGSSNAVVGRGSAADPGNGTDEPFVRTAADGWQRLRAVTGQITSWPPGTVTGLGEPGRHTEIDDLYAVDLAAIADLVLARGAAGRPVLVSSLAAVPATTDPGEQLAGLLSVPVRCLATEPEAARAGALTTPGATPGALVIDVGAGTIDLIAPGISVTAAGAGDLLTAAIAEVLGIPRAAADWVKRGPCIRVDGQRFEAEDGTRGFLDAPAPAAATGMLAVTGPGGLLPFGRRRSPGEWRSLRLAIKRVVLIQNFERAARPAGQRSAAVIITGGPAGDEELLGLLARTLPAGVPFGRANAAGELGHRYAVAFGLTLLE